MKSKDDLGQPGGRFDTSHGLGKIFRAHYTSGHEFEALTILQEVAVSDPLYTYLSSITNHYQTKNNTTLPSIALRWLQHHSKMTPEDGVIIGASSVQQVKDNIEYSELGPLPEDVLKACEEAWMIVKPLAPPYPR